MKFTIYKKIMAGFGVIIIIMMLANAYTLLKLGSVSNDIKVTLSSHVRTIDLAKKLQIILDDQSAYAQKYLISGDKTYFNMFSESNRMYYEELRSLEITNPRDGIAQAGNMAVAHGVAWVAYRPHDIPSTGFLDASRTRSLAIRPR